jgi:hypothetical protein
VKKTSIIAASSTASQYSADTAPRPVATGADRHELQLLSHYAFYADLLTRLVREHWSSCPAAVG